MAGGAAAVEQHLRQADRQFKKSNIRHALIRLSQPRAHEFEELQTHARALFQKSDDIAAFEHDELAFGKGGRIRGAFLAVEDRDLAKKLAGLEIGQNDALSARPRQRHPHSAVEDHHHALPRCAEMKNRLAGVEAAAVRMTGDGRAHVVSPLG